MKQEHVFSARTAASAILAAAAGCCLGLWLLSLKTCGSCADVPFTNDPAPLEALFLILGVALAAIVAVVIIKIVSSRRAKKKEPPQEAKEEGDE